MILEKEKEIGREKISRMRNKKKKSIENIQLKIK
jgi:hypothetical protein